LGLVYSTLIGFFPFFSFTVGPVLPAKSPSPGISSATSSLIVTFTPPRPMALKA
jgi:hypothetical protein